MPNYNVQRLRDELANYPDDADVYVKLRSDGRHEYEIYPLTFVRGGETSDELLHIATFHPLSFSEQDESTALVLFA